MADMRQRSLIGLASPGWMLRALLIMASAATSCAQDHRVLHPNGTGEVPQRPQPTDTCDCTRQDSILIGLSASIGALLMLMLVGCRPKRQCFASAKTAPCSQDQGMQTYERLPSQLLPPPVLPAQIQYLAMPLHRGTSSFAPRLVFDRPPKQPTVTAAIQTTPSGKQCSSQTDWHGMPSMVHRHMQTDCSPQSHPVGSQTQGIPTIHAVAQTWTAPKHASTQCLNVDSSSHLEFAVTADSSGMDVGKGCSQSAAPIRKQLAHARAACGTQTEDFARNRIINATSQTQTSHCNTAGTQTERRRRDVHLRHLEDAANEIGPIGRAAFPLAIQIMDEEWRTCRHSGSGPQVERSLMPLIKAILESSQNSKGP